MDDRDAPDCMLDARGALAARVCGGARAAMSWSNERIEISVTFHDDDRETWLEWREKIRAAVIDTCARDPKLRPLIVTVIGFDDVFSFPAGE